MMAHPPQGVVSGFPVVNNVLNSGQMSQDPARDAQAQEEIRSAAKTMRHLRAAFHVAAQMGEGVG